MKTIRHLLLLTLLVAAASLAHAQGDAPYNEGSVWDITTVKTKTGLQDDYLRQLKTIFVGELDEAKKQGLLLSYKILIGQAATAGDYDVMLLIEYKNFAALTTVCGRSSMPSTRNCSARRSSSGTRRSSVWRSEKSWAKSRCRK